MMYPEEALIVAQQYMLDLKDLKLELYDEGYSLSGDMAWNWSNRIKSAQNRIPVVFRALMQEDGIPSFDSDEHMQSLYCDFELEELKEEWAKPRNWVALKSLIAEYLGHMSELGRVLEEACINDEYQCPIWAEVEEGEQSEKENTQWILVTIETVSGEHSHLHKTLTRYNISANDLDVVKDQTIRLMAGGLEMTREENGWYDCELLGNKYRIELIEKVDSEDVETLKKYGF